MRLSTGEGASVTRLVASRGRARVQIEPTPVMCGTVHPVRNLVVCPRVGEVLGSASVQVLDFADLYAGKLAASLSTEHPRDIFDVSLLLEDERAEQMLCRTFLVYLTCSPKPTWEMLASRVPADFAVIFEALFRGMTAEPIEVEALLDIHERLLAHVAGWPDEPSCVFLRSVEGQRPNFDLIGLPHAADLPAVRRKLPNLTQRTDVKRAAGQRLLEETLARIVGVG